MDKPKGFMCYCSWREALGKLPPTARLRVYDAIFEYVDTGKVPQLKKTEEAPFAFIKSDIDRALTKYKDRCEKNREIAQKREDEKRKARTSTNVRKDKEDDRDRDRDRDREKDRDKDKEKDKNIPEKVQEVKYNSDEHTTSCDESNYSKFCQWIKEHTPYLYENCERLITEMELKKLLRSYTIAEICGIIVSIENRRDKRQTYTNLYLTTFNWLKREYGKPSERPVLR